MHLAELPFTHLSASDIRALEEIMKILPVGATCVEVGSYLGASSIVIASHMPPGSSLWCIDTWANDAMSEGPRDTYADFVRNTKRYTDKLIPLRKTSVEAAANFSGKIDFLFIDGDHSYEGCKADLDSWLPKVKPGGIVALHDVWADGVKRAIRECLLPVQSGPGQ